jgi:hypothetical protein
LIVASLLVGELSAILEGGDIVGAMLSLSVTGAGLVGGFVAVELVIVVDKDCFGKPQQNPGRGDASA